MSYQDDYNPFQNVSYLELNKRKRGDYVRDEHERIENRFAKPAVKKLYLKRNGEEIDKRAKLFVWREWQSPGLRNLLAEVGNSLNLPDGAKAIYDLSGEKIEHPDDLHHLGTYYITGDEQLLIPDSSDDFHNYNHRHTSLSAPEFSATRDSIYEDASFPPTPPPKPYTSDPYLHQPTKTKKKKKTVYPGNSKLAPNLEDDHRRQMDEFERYYREAVMSPNYEQEEPSQSSTHQRRRESYEENPRYRSRSTNEDYSHRMNSDFDDHDWIQKDRRALQKHKEKVMARTRSNSTVIYNRRDQTHPDAYILYVFLNGHGMECQYINFQKRQLERGMHYIMELIARRYSVNPAKLCNMDGKKIGEVSHLMSRGAYVLVPVGQSFRDTWYFLPDNAIDTSSSQARIEDRNNQRDRFLQKKEKRENIKKKTKGFVDTPKNSKCTATKRRKILAKRCPTPPVTGNTENIIREDSFPENNE